MTAPAQPPRPFRALVALLLACWFGLSPAPAAALNDAQQLVVEAWRLVNQSYLDPSQLEAIHWRQLRQHTLEQPIDSSSQAYDAISAMLEPLGDPYTRLLRPQEYASLRSNTRGSVSGVGLQLGQRGSDQRIVVIAPLDGSPAAEAGVVSGSELRSIEGHPTAELGLEGSAALLRGPAGTRVDLVVVNPAGDSRELVLQRREVDLQPVRRQHLQLEGHDLGYLRITQFSEPVPQQVEEALTAFRQGDSDGRPVEGILLDLRNNSGGLVSAGVAVANAFLDGATIVETEDRGGISARQQASAGDLWSGPLLTLVNGGTASASEILAGALQDNGRSSLVGTRTFGKGLIQTLVALGDGSGLAVTVARYLTPAGHDIQHQGIAPDISLAEPEPLNPGGAEDAWRLAAARLLLASLEER